MKGRDLSLLITMFLALAAVRGTRMATDELSLRILTWVLAAAIAVLTVASIRIPHAKWIVPATATCSFALLLVPPSPTSWLGWMPDSLVAFMLLAFLSQLYRIKTDEVPDTDRRDRIGAVTRMLPLAGGLVAVVTLPTLYGRVVPERLAAGFELGSALGPLAAGLAVATGIALYVLLRTVLAPGAMRSDAAAESKGVADAV